MIANKCFFTAKQNFLSTSHEGTTFSSKFFAEHNFDTHSDPAVQRHLMYIGEYNYCTHRSRSLTCNPSGRPQVPGSESVNLCQAHSSYIVVCLRPKLLCNWREIYYCAVPSGTVHPFVPQKIVPNTRTIQHPPPF